MPNPAKWKKFSEEEIRDIFANSISFSEVARCLGYSLPKGRSSGSSNTAIKQAAEFYNIDISHFLGQGARKGQFDYSWMVNNHLYNSNYAASLIHLRGRQCECCKLTTWLEQPINLEVHHINGNKYNNEASNLQLLCPNCHSYTEGYRGRK